MNIRAIILQVAEGNGVCDTLNHLIPSARTSSATQETSSEYNNYRIIHSNKNSVRKYEVTEANKQYLLRKFEKEHNFPNFIRTYYNSYGELTFCTIDNILIDHQLDSRLKELYMLAENSNDDGLVELLHCYEGSLQGLCDHVKSHLAQAVG
jgi:hypothetical protein